jgi:hypothetical protein
MNVPGLVSTFDSERNKIGLVPPGGLEALFCGFEVWMACGRGERVPDEEEQKSDKFSSKIVLRIRCVPFSHPA